MARKIKHPEHVNHERWLVSYADFITLLFATFTALFAISNRDMEKFKKLAASIKEAFSEGPKTLVQIPSVTQNGGADPNAPLVITITPTLQNQGHGEKEKEGEPASQVSEATSNKAPSQDAENQNTMFVKVQPEVTPSAHAAVTATPGPSPMPSPSVQEPQAEPEGTADPALAEEIKELIDTAGLKEKVDVRQEQRGMVISLGEAAFFESGAVEVHPQSTHQLDKIVNLLRGKNLDIRIEGHTDNTPVRSGKYRSNLELSTLRAARIAEFMIEEYHFPSDHLSSAGYGEFRPVAENTTDEGRRKNRRVDIVILNRRAAMAEPHAALRASPNDNVQSKP